MSTPCVRENAMGARKARIRQQRESAELCCVAGRRCLVDRRWGRAAEQVEADPPHAPGKRRNGDGALNLTDGNRSDPLGGRHRRMHCDAEQAMVGGTGWRAARSVSLRTLRGFPSGRSAVVVNVAGSDARPQGDEQHTQKRQNAGPRRLGCPIATGRGQLSASVSVMSREAAHGRSSRVT